MTNSVTAQLGEVFADAGVTGWLHARLLDRCDGSAEVASAADIPVPMASLFKVPLAAAWAVRVEYGQLDPCAQIRLPANGRSDGPTGLSVLLDPVVMSSRDLVRLMLTISDNAAADAVLDLVGLDFVNELVGAWGLPRTILRGGASATLDRLGSELGVDGFAAAMRRLAELDREVQTSEYDPALTSATTARELTAMLARLWAMNGSASDLVRTAMAQQAWRHRIGSGFPHDDVVVAAKSGTLGTLRHEVAVIQFPAEHPVAVAVLTRAARPERHLPAVDTAIGAAARLAVQRLRRPLA